ncbi:hypothetical protein SKAU_G00047970 [Synaphobranchus kaupii]|uniref:Uncharacterized protein n=1 Tax=Synaphobranchus kaupii TaxID=118154 RepID=A0A9Q1G3E3_SYNKA|nr:hypothetical protein SKAU_G00047970 [Synaphobranchus kaupii]
MAVARKGSLVGFDLGDRKEAAVRWRRGSKGPWHYHPPASSRCPLGLCGCSELRGAFGNLWESRDSRNCGPPAEE